MDDLLNNLLYHRDPFPYEGRMGSRGVTALNDVMTEVALDRIKLEEISTGSLFGYKDL